MDGFEVTTGYLTQHGGRQSCRRRDQERQSLQSRTLVLEVFKRLHDSFEAFGDELQSPRRDLRAFRAHVGHNIFVIEEDRKSTRLNSSHLGISYAVFCLKKK